MVALMKQEGESSVGRSLAIGAGVLAAGMMLVDILPNMLKSLYAALNHELIFGYGVFAFGSMGILVAIVAFGVVRDLPVFFETATFGWRTREAYLSGSAKKEKTKQRDTK